MKNNPCIRIGHLKIIDHLILGISDLCLKDAAVKHSAINLETHAMRSWDQVADSLISKQIDGAFIPAPIAMNLFAQGLDIRILMFVHRSGSLIVKSTRSQIKTIADFKNKTILVPSELSIQNMLLHRLLASAGLALGTHGHGNVDVFREVVPPWIMTEMLAHDQDNDIGGYAVAEPYASHGIRQGVAKKLCTSASLWKNHPCCVFVLKQSFIQDNPRLVQELISLFVQTGHQIENNNNDQIMNMAETFLESDQAMIRNMLMQTDICFNPDLLIPDMDALDIIQNYMADTMKVLNTKIDISRLVDPSFISNPIPGN
ncbi:MAG: ABC transporter substrate-binding protein [Pseudomonadota bacterium]